MDEFKDEISKLPVREFDAQHLDSTFNLVDVKHKE